MIQSMSLSIIVPTLNAASTIGRALESVLCQTFPDWELLLMDGGSSDGTAAIASNYNDSRIKIQVYHNTERYTCLQQLHRDE